MTNYYIKNHHFFIAFSLLSRFSLPDHPYPGYCSRSVQAFPTTSTNGEATLTLLCLQPVHPSPESASHGVEIERNRLRTPRPT